MHNWLWGSAHNCTSGKNLVEVICDDSELIALNDGSMTYAKLTDNEDPVLSAIDLTLA